MQEENVDLSGIVSARAMRLFRISRVTRVAKAASFFGALRRESFAVSFIFVRFQKSLFFFCFLSFYFSTFLHFSPLFSTFLFSPPPSFFFNFLGLSDLIADSVVFVFEVQCMTLVAVAVTSLTLSTVTSNFGDNGTCSAGTKGILQFLNFHTFRSSLVTLTLSFGWNNVWEIFQGCVSISDTTDAFIYLIWIATVVTFAPKNDYCHCCI